MKSKLRVLFWDIETSPILCWLFKPGYGINVGPEAIKDGEKTDIICLSWKWLGKREVRSLDWGLRTQNSEAMIDAFTKVIESADLVIGQNGDKFDMRHFNTQRMLHKQKPIAWPTSEDTLKQMRKHFAFPSYKLDYIAKLLTGSGKASMELRDWVQIKQYKSAKHLDKMLRYNRRDVRKLESVFKRIEPYCTPKLHAGKAAGLSGLSCPRCASTQQAKNGTKVRITGRYQRYQCSDCGTVYLDSKRVAI